MNIFDKKFFLAAVMLVFCIVSISGAQETTDEEGTVQGGTDTESVDDTGARNAFDNLKESLRNYDFETAWGMVSQSERLESFGGDAEAFKTYLSKPERFNKIIDFEVETTEPLGRGRIKLISGKGKFFLMVKEGASWKYGGKGIDLKKSGKAKGNPPKGAKPNGKVKEKPVDKNHDD